MYLSDLFYLGGRGRGEVRGEGGKDNRQNLGKRYTKSFIAFEHTLCLTKNLPFCLEYIYFIYICSILCFCFRFLFILGDVGGTGVHRSAHMK